MATVTHKFFPNVGKKTKNGKIPVYFRIGLRKQKAEYRLNAEVAERDLEYWNERIMRFDIPKFPVNDSIDDVSITFKKFVSLNEFNLQHYDAKKIMDALFKKHNPVDNKPLWKDFYWSYFDNSIKNKTALEKGTKTNYRKALNHMDSFLKLTGQEKLKICEVDMKFAREFKDYLLNEKAIKDENTGKPKIFKGMSEPSALGQIKKFRTILEIAIDESLHDRNFFKKIKLSNTSPEGDNLTPFQVKALYHSNHLLTDTLILYRDIFLWSAFTGIAYGDAANLQSCKISKQSEDDYRLTSRRGKTNESYDQFLPKAAIQIMEKYKNHPDVIFSEGVIPKRSNKQINDHLKIIAQLINLPVNLTTHVARRTFRQLIGEAGIEADSVIKKLMGHSNNKNIDSRYYKVTEKPLLEARKKLDFLIINELEIK